ncbi:hypothetical protein ACRRTK_011382 [Alexandromys fortis]
MKRSNNSGHSVGSTCLSPSTKTKPTEYIPRCHPNAQSRHAIYISQQNLQPTCTLPYSLNTTPPSILIIS